MHQRGRLKGVSRLFPSHLLRSQLAKFLVNQRQQFVRGSWIAVLNGVENARHVAHAFGTIERTSVRFKPGEVSAPVSVLFHWCRYRSSAMIGSA